MKRLYTLFFLFFIGISGIAAQMAAGCDGMRYIAPLFGEVTTTFGVEYGSNVNVSGIEQTLRMDVFEPANDDLEQRPLIIFAHGGSFITGNRTDMSAVCEQYATLGYVTATIDYRLWPVFTMGLPDSLQMLDVVVKAVHDMKAAVRYFRADATAGNSFGIDPNLIFVGGLSAGGVMACHTGMLDTEDAIPDFVEAILEDNGGLEGTSGNEEVSSQVQAVINFSGGIYQTSWVDSDDPPILSMHGTNDQTVPYNYGLAAGVMSLHGSGSIHTAAEQVGVSNYLVSVPNGGHTDIYTSPTYAPYQVDLTTNGSAFLEGILCGLSSSTDVLAQTDIQIYPNPASSVATVQLVSEENIGAELLVYDQLGRCVFRTNKLPTSPYTLHQSEIGTGLFFVQIRQPNGQIMAVEPIIFE